MDFEDILKFESDLNDKHYDITSAKDTFKILASDERKLKRLRLKLSALNVDVTSIDTALSNFSAKRNAADAGYKSVIADLYEFVGYDAYNRALEQGHKLACYARGAQLNKKSAGVGKFARGEHESVAANLFVESLADFRQRIKKKLILLKKVRAKLSPVRYDTVRTRNEWLALKLELRLLRRACNIASFRMGNRAPIRSACEFNTRISYVIHNAISIEVGKNNRKYFYEDRPYVETTFDVEPFPKQPLRRLRRKASEADLTVSVVRKTNGSVFMPRPPNR